MATPDYEPEVRVITAITNAKNAAVTTSVAHGFDDGSYVRIVVPRQYGMHIDYIETKITITGANTFTCNDLDTDGIDAFVVPGTIETPAHVCPSSQAINNVAT